MKIHKQYLRCCVPFSIIICCTLFSAAAGAAAADPFTLAKLEDLGTKLRDGDHRLVRPSPTDETAAQQQAICPDIIPSLVQTVVVVGDSDDDLSTRGAAAEVLHLCTTNHPENRAAIGSVESGTIHAGLTKLVNEEVLEFWSSGSTTMYGMKGAGKQSAAEGED